MIALKKLCKDFLVPQRDKPKEFGGSIPWCRIEDIEGKYLNGTKSKQYVTEDTVKRMNLKVIPKGAVICSCSASLGVQAILTTPCVTNQTFIGIVPEEKLSAEFLYYYLKSRRAYFNKIGTGTTIPYISRKKFEELIIPDISLDEQANIVEVLEKVEKIINLRKKEIAYLDALIKARFVELMEKSDLGSETTIESITKRVKVGFVGTCEKYYTDESGIPMLRTGNITEKGIDLSDLKYVTAEFHNKNQKSQIHAGDLLIARHGSNGQANVYFGPDAQCLNAVVIVPDQEIASSVFLAGLINSPAVKRQIERTLVGSTQHVVNTKSIAGLFVRIPNMDVQKEYESFVMQVDKSKRIISKGLDESVLLFNSLMQRYFG